MGNDARVPVSEDTRDRLAEWKGGDTYNEAVNQLLDRAGDVGPLPGGEVPDVSYPDEPVEAELTQAERNRIREAVRSELRDFLADVQR